MSGHEDTETKPGSLHWKPPTDFGADLDSIGFVSERLLVRLCRIDDADAMFAALESSRAEVDGWETWARRCTSLDHARQHVVRQRLHAPELLTHKALDLGIFEKASGDFVGHTGFHSLNADTAAAEIGYWIRSERTGLGYATEANGGLISWLLGSQAAGGLGLTRVRANCSGDNPGSARVLAKLGLPLEVRRPREYYVRGLDRITDLLGFGVLRSEWDFETNRAKPDAERLR